MGKEEIEIRAFEMGDWEDVAELFLVRRCQRETLQMPFQSRDALRAKLENPPAGMLRLVALDGETGRAVGLIGLHPHGGRRSHSGSIGMFVHDEHQGKGIGSRLLAALLEMADKWLALSRIELTVYTDNEPALRLYQKHDFAIEGTHRRYALRDGEYIDAHFMARLREPAWKR